LHPLQYAGLSRRSLTPCFTPPATSDLPPTKHRSFPVYRLLLSVLLRAPLCCKLGWGVGNLPDHLGGSGGNQK
jgi:hypothetical protein